MDIDDIKIEDWDPELPNLQSKIDNRTLKGKSVELFPCVKVEIKEEQNDEFDEKCSIEDPLNIEVTEESKHKVYNGMKNHKCGLCGKSFKIRENLETHIYFVHTFTQAGSLKAHVKSVHEDVKDQKCNHCGKCFSTKSNLKTHINNVHERVKEFECDICGKSYTQAGNLKSHMKSVHEKIKDHKCDICEKGFSQAGNLKSHVKSVHEKVKNHKCDICGKYFTRARDHNIHIKTIHERVKYKCAYCENDFENIESLKTHVKTVHETTKCSLCDFYCHDILTHNCSVLLSWDLELSHPHNDVQNGYFRHCKICKSSFYQKIDWIQHIKYIHGG